MPIARNMLFALCMAALPPAAHGAWLRCIASGTDAGGAFAVDTAVVNVGDLPPARLDHLKERLLAHVKSSDPKAKGLQATCFASDDQTAASSHYGRSWMQLVRRLGWENVSVLRPEIWLDDSDYFDGAAQSSQ